MRLSDILSPSRATTQSAPQSKGEALRTLADLFAEDDPKLDAESIFSALEQREKLASTGVGSGVAVPHGRIDAIEDLRAAVAIVPEGVSFEAIDGQPVRILIALLSPRQQSGVHIKALARISRILRDPGVRDRLVDVDGGEEAVSVLLEADGIH